MQSVAANDPMAQLVIGAAIDSIAPNGRESISTFISYMAPGVA
jgi:hypothetical protein